MDKDFYKFATSNGVNGLVLHDYVRQFNGSMVSPNIVEERPMNMIQMDVFSKLFTSRILFLGTEINDDVANIINSQLLYLQMDNPTQGVDLYINSPGGSVYNGLSIYDTMQYISCPVSTTCIGMAASMASIILSSGEKGKRFALPHSRVLLHQPMGGIAPGTQASDFEIANKEIQILKKELFEILSANTGKDFETIKKDGDRDFWLTAQEAKEYGLIDDIITKKNNNKV